MSVFDLYREVYRLVKQIPEGQISTYKEIAIALGDEIAARAIGEVLNQNPFPIEVPCHRVVHEDMRIGGYRLGVTEKIEILKKEGVKIENSRVNAPVFREFRSSKPLEKMRMEQERLSRRAKIRTHTNSDFEFFAGFDVSYKERFGKAALCVMDKKLNIVDRKVVYGLAKMPYIPTYLGYKELPFFKKLKWDEKFLLFVDGNGIMHPRFFGSASLIGFKFDLPTIGVAKSRLIGETRDGEVFYKDRKVGYKKGHIFISPGYKVSLENSLYLADKCSIYKTPEPLRQAHLLAKINENK